MLRRGHIFRKKRVLHIAEGLRPGLECGVTAITVQRYEIA
jgi:hypothetical protein